MVVRRAAKGWHLKRPRTGEWGALPAIVLATAFFTGLRYIFASQEVGLGGVIFVAAVLALLTYLQGWWLRARRLDDDAWITRLSVFLVDHYPVSREDVALIFAKRWAFRLPLTSYRFNAGSGPRRDGARYWVKVTRDGVLTISRDWSRTDPVTLTTIRRYTAVPMTKGLAAAPSGTHTPSLISASSTLMVFLTPQPKLTWRSGPLNEAATMGLVLALAACVVVEGLFNRPMLTGFFGAVAAVLLAYVASLAAFGTTTNLKRTARWRMVAAAELAEVGKNYLTFPDALALLHSDRDSRSKTVQHLTFGRFMGDHFTCVRGDKRLSLHPVTSGWTLTVSPA